MDKPNLTTQTIHTHPIADTPAGPLLITYNITAGWFAVTAPAEIPADLLPALMVGLAFVGRELKQDPTIRKMGEDGR